MKATIFIALIIICAVAINFAQTRRPVPPPAPPVRIVPDAVLISANTVLHSGANNPLSVSLTGPVAFDRTQLRCESSNPRVAYIRYVGDVWVSGILAGRAQVRCSYRGVKSNILDFVTIEPPRADQHGRASATGTR